jgi:uncharacterized secreted protein with C-terminal beta-propeller domain
MTSTAPGPRSPSATGRRGPALAAVAVALVAVCAGSAVPLATVLPATVPPAGSGGPVGLVTFDSCDGVLRDFRAASAPHVGPYGFDEGGAVPVSGRGDVLTQDAAGVPEARAAAPVQQAPDHTGTTVQEAGVDEPDLVKTDGRRVVTVVDGRLRVVDTATRRQTGVLDLGALGLGAGAVSQLLLHGDRALLIASRHPGFVADVAPAGPGRPAPPVPPVPGTGTTLAQVDLSGEPRVLATLDLDGAHVDARQVGAVVRVVLRSAPDLPFVRPTDRDGHARALLENRAVLDRSRIEDWLPHYSLTSAGTTREGVLVDCSRVSRPVVPVPERVAALLTVLTFDLPVPLGTGDPVSISADGDTVLGTATSLYVAGDHRSAAGSTTTIHQFDVSRPGPPAHVASGAVEGVLLDRYALSEHAGHLRVATTTDPLPATESAVTVLRREGGGLVRTGRVAGLGPGELIRGVRFAGDTGYVVTFRQTDPLYVLDLADPAAPRAAGELKITGYSAHLRPTGNGLLLGVGQEATDRGARLGTQVSLFDVGDPAAPRRLATHHVPGSSTEAEFDPHAFLHDEETGLIVLPVAEDGAARRRSTPAAPGALVLSLRNAALTEIGTVRHPASALSAGGVRRSFLVAGELWTLSAAGIVVSGIETLDQRALVPFD